MSAQNIYDDPQFFAGYSQLTRSVQGLNGAPEWPALRALLPPLAGRRVLDLGCGFGWFSRWALGQGASEVLGLDVSENMLARARAEGPADGATALRYQRTDLEHLERLSLPEAGFDLAYSSLVLHYIENLDGLLAELKRLLAPGAALVLSLEHPIFTAPRRQGWARDADGQRHWPVDGYALEGPRVSDWLASGVIKQHRRLDSYLNALLRHGFVLSNLQEWHPSDAQIAAAPALAEERERPMFLLIAARRV